MQVAIRLYWPRGRPSDRLVGCGFDRSIRPEVITTSPPETTVAPTGGRRRLAARHGPVRDSACNSILGGHPRRVVAAAEIHPEFGVDGLTSALPDYGGRHASITASVHSGPT
jgi:hypothetical protein